MILLKQLYNDEYTVINYSLRFVVFYKFQQINFTKDRSTKELVACNFLQMPSLEIANVTFKDRRYPIT